jgi:chemotaxis protein MotB
MSSTLKRICLTLCPVILVGCVSTSKYRQQEQLATQFATEKQTLQEMVDALYKEKTAMTEVQQAKDAEIARLKGTYDQLVDSLKGEIASGEIQVTQLKDKLTLKLIEKILFDSGRAEIKAGGKKVLDRIGQVLKKVQDKDIRIEGHTDNVKVGPKLRERYPTNWELSTTRASNVVRYLQEKAGVDPKRLIAAGYGEYHPIALNDTPVGQAANRRIDIVLVAPEIAAPVPPMMPVMRPSVPPPPPATHK